MLVKSKVKGMTCGNCALTISKYLEKKGATNITANPATGDVIFEVIENEESVLNGINKLGYTVEASNVKFKSNESGLANSVQMQSNFFETNKLVVFCAILWLPLVAHMFLNMPILHNPWFQFALATPIYIICVLYFGKSALRSIINRIANMDVLIFIGASAAYWYSIIGWYMHPHHVHNYLFFETTASIVTLVLLGNLLEELSVKATTSSVASLAALQKTNAKLVIIDSIGKESIQTIENTFLKLNDIIQLNTGDKVPVDAEILSGELIIDESMMTGESIPVRKTTGQAIVGGTVIVDGNGRIKATGIGEDTALANILRLVNEAQSIKSPMQKLADKISAIFVPLVLGISLLTFLITYFFTDLPFVNVMMRSIAVLVVACPCAMGLATPAAVMVGLGRAAKNGILIRGADTLEKFKDIKQIVLDKTGTITTGKIKINTIEFLDKNEDEVKRVLYSIEKKSSHPIAVSIVNELRGIQEIELKSIEEEKGLGLRANDAENNTWQVGSYKIASEGVSKNSDIYINKNNKTVAYLTLIDELKPNASQVVKQLKEMGIKTILLSGDREAKCKSIVEQIGIDEYYAEHTPIQKQEKIKQLMQIAPTAMIGDGVNDAPSLVQATIGISFAEATQIASQSARVILLKNDLAQIPFSLGLGKHTYLTIKQNLAWAFLYNIVTIPIAAFGLLTPTFGAGLMALSDVVLVINSLRLRWKKVF